MRILTTYPVALPPELMNCTTVREREQFTKFERWLASSGFNSTARRICAIRSARKIARLADGYDIIVSTGDLEGLTLAALLGRKEKRPVHVMYDCLWYGGGWLRRKWMQLCARGTDSFVVWASVERRRYSRAYGIAEEKFVFVPHHHTLKRFDVEVRNEPYVFCGGNADRDYDFFCRAVAGLPIRFVLATNRPKLLQGVSIPNNVEVCSLSPAEFRQRMAESRIVVMPMRATLLHAGAQQSILNAMMLGKAVVLTDPEGGADYISNWKTGVMVPYGDTAALRDAIERLWANPEMCEEIGKHAKSAALPRTTEQCNIEIWEHAIALLDRDAKAAQLDRSECSANV